MGELVARFMMKLTHAPLVLPNVSYQFNPPLINMDITINILTKALTVFPSSAFSLSLSLLPPYTQPFSTSAATSSQNPLPVQIAEFVESVQKLTLLNTLLESAQYEAFWSALDGDDIYADLIADVAGFEDLIRIRIAVEVGKVYRDIKTHTMMQWLAIKNADEVVKFVQSVGSWSVDGEGENGVLRIPANKENEVRSEVRNEKVGIEQFGRVIRRGFEQHI